MIQNVQRIRDLAEAALRDVGRDEEAAGLQVVGANLRQIILLCQLPDRKPLTPRQRQMLDFVSVYSDEHGYAPTFREIATEFGYASLATVHEHLESLRWKGWITRTFNDARGITVLASAV